MAEGSPELYQRRKKRKLEAQSPRPTFETNSLPSHDRPHRTIPELVEHDPDSWVPPPEPPVEICQFDTGAQFDTGGQYDTPCEGPVPPAPTVMVWDTGVAWDSGWVWL